MKDFYIWREQKGYGKEGELKNLPVGKPYTATQILSEQMIEYLKEKNIDCTADEAGLKDNINMGMVFANLKSKVEAIK